MDIRPDAFRGQRFWTTAAWATLVAAVAAIALANSLGNGFVWDDFDIVVDNPQTHDVANLGEVLLSPDLTPPYYRPVARGLFVLEYAAWGPSPRPYHALSLALHVLASLLLFLWTRTLLRWTPGRPPPAGGRGDAIAAGATLLWACHPVASEAVGFVSVRTNPLVVLFMLASLLAFTHGVRSGAARSRWLSGLLLLVALGSKEQAVMVVPLAALVLLRARSDRPVAALLPLGVALAVYLAARVTALGGLLGDVPQAVGRTATGPGGMVWIVGRAVELLVWPGPLTITHAVGAPGLHTLSAGAAVVASGLLLRWHRTPATVLGLAWFWLTLLPTLQAVALPSSPFAERHLYVMFAGLAPVAAALLHAALTAPEARTAVATSVVAVVAAVVALTARTIDRNRDWRDNRALFESALAVGPSALAHLNLGNLARNEEDLASAEAHWRAAVELDPRDADALNQLGVLAARAGRLDVARGFFQRAVEALPSHPVARRNIQRLDELAVREPRRRR